MKTLRSTSRLSEILAFLIYLLKEISKYDFTADVFMTNAKTNLDAFTVDFKKSIEKTKTKSKLKAYDKKRDKSLRCFIKTVRALTEHSNPTYSNAALTILPVVNKYKLAIIKSGYSAETGMIHNLFGEMNSDINTNNLNLMPFVAEEYANLQTVQAEFESIYTTYKATRGKQDKAKTGTSNKDEAFDLMNNLLYYINAMAGTEGSEDTFAPLLVAINEMIDSNNKVVDTRLTKAENAKNSREQNNLEIDDLDLDDIDIDENEFDDIDIEADES